MYIGVSKSVKDDNYKELFNEMNNIPLLQLMYKSNKHNMDKLNAAKGIKKIVSHCRYYATMTFPYNHKRKWVSSDILSDQLANYTLNNSKYNSLAVIHMGNDKGNVIENVIDHCRNYLETIDNKSLDYIKPKLLFENEALTKNTFSHDLDNLIELRDSLNELTKRDVFSYCIDTCHLNTVGNNNVGKINREYSLLDSDKDSLKNSRKLIKKMDELNVELIHLNDTKHEYLDRHAGISKGLLNIKCLRKFYRYAKRKNIDIILENNLSTISYEEQVKLLK